MAQSGEFLTYKGKPLVRKGNILYYGNMYDPYVVMLNVKSTTKKGDIEVAEKVSIQLIATDPNLNPIESIIKTSEKTGLFNAMDIGSIWLERALKDAK